DPVSVDVLSVPGVCLENREDDVLLAGARKAVQAQGLSKIDQVGRRTGLELRQVHHILAERELIRRDDFEAGVVIRIFFRMTSPPPAAVAPLATLATLA